MGIDSNGRAKVIFSIILILLLIGGIGFAVYYFFLRGMF